MTKNNNLHNAKRAKNDEFYTRLEDIEKEMCHYREHFRGKVIYCNCDDPKESNFFKFFSLQFEFLGLKKLISTGYKENGHGVAYIYEGDKNENNLPDDSEIRTYELQGNGDFRSEECIEFLKEADIVVTNPPFSLFREYVAQLVEYGKEFLIVGNSNAITYKEIFPLIKENKLWLGINPVKEFITPLTEIENEKTQYIKEGKVYQKFGNICWFTNMGHPKRNRPLDLTQRYDPRYYPKYDNYDAIECSKVMDIPRDYDGVIGVPITFLDKYCPTQFRIVGLLCDNRCGYPMLNGIPTYTDEKHKNSVCGVLNGKGVYPRVIIEKI